MLELSCCSPRFLDCCLDPDFLILELGAPSGSALRDPLRAHDRVELAENVGEPDHLAPRAPAFGLFAIGSSLDRALPVLLGLHPGHIEPRDLGRNGEKVDRAKMLGERPLEPLNPTVFEE